MMTKELQSIFSLVSHISAESGVDCISVLNDALLILAASVRGIGRIPPDFLTRLLEMSKVYREYELATFRELIGHLGGQP